MSPMTGLRTIRALPAINMSRRRNKEGRRFRVQGLGFRVQGSGFREKSTQNFKPKTQNVLICVRIFALSNLTTCQTSDRLPVGS